MDKITLYDNDFILAPYAWGKGNGTTSYSSGSFPVYRGLYTAEFAALSGVPLGYTYVPDGSRIRLYPDADGDRLDTNYDLQLTNTNDFTMEFWGLVGSFNTHRDICGTRDGSTDYFRWQIQNNNKLRVLIRDGADLRYITGSGDVSIGLHHFVLKKSAGDITLYLDGSGILYDLRDTYDLGDFSWTEKLEVGRYGAGTASWQNYMYWFRITHRALSDDEIMYNYTLGVDNNGLIGNSQGNIMYLSYPPELGVVPGKKTLLQKRLRGITFGTGMV